MFGKSLEHRPPGNSLTGEWALVDNPFPRHIGDSDRKGGMTE